MPNGVKYSTTTPSGSLRRGNVALGVTSNLGPSATTGFYSMPAPQSGKYIINKVSPSGIPNFFAPANDAELIRLARTEGAVGADTGSAAAVLAWMATQDNLEAVNIEYESIVTDGLILNLDAGFTPSYPTTGSVWYNLSGSNNITMYNSGGSTYTSNPPGPPTFISSNNGIFSFSTDDWGKFTSNITAGSAVTFAVWLKTTDTGASNGILSNCSGGPVNLAYVISSGKMRYWYYTSPWQIYDGPTSVNDGNWKYLVWAKNGTNMVLYINGVQDVSTTLVGDVTGPINCVGSMWGPCNSDSYGPGTDFYGQCFNGTISIIQIYNKQLTSSEVLNNYNTQKSRFGL